MPSEPTTLHAQACDDCGLIPLRPTDPRELLKKLPVRSGARGLFRGDGPSLPLGLRLDDPDSGVALGPAYPRYDSDGNIRYTTNNDGDTVPIEDDPPLIFEIARLLTTERDAFRRGIEQAAALQRGIVNLHVDVGSGRSTGDGVYALGVDLDLIGRSYGIGRPFGFTDCCYWRLIELLLWQKGGPTPWRAREVATLYTGRRPLAVIEPDLLTLTWGAARARGYADRGAYADHSYGIHDPEVDVDPPITPKPGNGYATTTNRTNSAYARSVGTHSIGMTLTQALDRVIPDGMHIRLNNVPQHGGCLGSVFRGLPRAVGATYAP